MPQESYEWYKTLVLELKSNITSGSYSSMYVNETHFYILYIVTNKLQLKLTFYFLIFLIIVFKITIKQSNNALVVDFVKFTMACQKPCLVGLSAVNLTFKNRASCI
jgi:hypothetical protein